MVVAELIEKLKQSRNLSKTLMASIGKSTTENLFIDLFVNSNSLPALMVSEEEPLPSKKLCSDLLKELLSWEKDSINYNPKSDIYLITNYEYDDESYDFRYYKIKSVNYEYDNIVLITDSDECLELREHFEAFDDSMLE